MVWYGWIVKERKNIFVVVESESKSLPLLFAMQSTRIHDLLANFHSCSQPKNKSSKKNKDFFLERKFLVFFSSFSCL